MASLTTDDVYALCVKNDWFTCGSGEQYSKMFDCVEQGMLIYEIALIIWICSEDVELFDIENELKKAA